MQKQYLNDLIRERYKEWERKKVLITAPTGIGKTTFVIEKLLPYLRNKEKKLLILCNRKMLRLQYWRDLILRFDSYADLEKCVTLKTYQQLSEEWSDKMDTEENVRGLLREYYCVVLDECHYFYADSDFNGFGTFALLQALVCAGMAKTMIFMSATMEEVEPLICTTIHKCYIKLSYGCNGKSYAGCGEIVPLPYSHLADFNRFQCKMVPDLATLCRVLKESNKKTLLFIDSIKRGEELAKGLINIGIQQQDVVLLHADNMDGSKSGDVVRQLAVAHKQIPKILISTAVLDNGVSIHDTSVGNIVILTESKLSFLQMIGRLRGETTENCNLIFVKRDSKAFINRMNRYQKYVERFKELDKLPPDQHPIHYQNIMWNQQDEELVHFYASSLVYIGHELQYFKRPEGKYYAVYGTKGLYVNEFARHKIGDMYLAESKFYLLAEEDPLKVIYEQMSWIGKKPSELEIYDSELRKQFIAELLRVQDFAGEKFQEFKEQLVKKFHKELFPEIPAKNGSLSNEKLGKICQKYELVLNKYQNPQDRCQRYSIVKKVEKKEGSS